MSALTELGERIKGVENIQRITRTLATVAAARLSRARRRAAGMREYAERFRGILVRQHAYVTRAGLEIARYSDLLRPREPVTNIALLVITADRGMCGGYNLEACRLAAEFWKKNREEGRNVRFIAIGQKGIRFLTKRRAEIIHQETWRREGISASAVERLLKMMVVSYRSGAVDAVHAVYTEFHTAIRRVPRVRRILPVQLDLGGTEPDAVDASDRWHYEPAFQDVIEELVAVYLRVQLSGMLLESSASEQGARMITMEEATERADKALQGYRVQHNRLRREVITTDLIGALFASSALRGSAPGIPGPR